jgi:hypothetical protein
MNSRLGNIRSGYKRGQDDRDGTIEQKEFDLRSKLRKEQATRRMGGGGSGTNKESRYFNCSRDGHFQASCTNPQFSYNRKKDGHRAMSCPVNKGLNLRICGFRMPRQAFYSIQVPEERGSNQMRTYPGIFTIRDGVADESIIDK